MMFCLCFCILGFLPSYACVRLFLSVFFFSFSLYGCIQELELQSVSIVYFLFFFFSPGIVATILAILYSSFRAFQFVIFLSSIGIFRLGKGWSGV